MATHIKFHLLPDTLLGLFADWFMQVQVSVLAPMSFHTRIALAAFGQFFFRPYPIPTYSLPVAEQLSRADLSEAGKPWTESTDHRPPIQASRSDLPTTWPIPDALSLPAGPIDVNALGGQVRRAGQGAGEQG
jgi:hypothetical protein